MKYDDFQKYLEMEYTKIYGDYYECNGGHIWYIDAIEEQYQVEVKEQAQELKDH